MSRIPARPAQSWISPAFSAGSARLDAAVAFEEAPLWELSPSQQAPTQSSIESRLTLVTEPSEQQSPSPDPKPEPELPPADSKPESAIVQVAAAQPMASQPLPSLPVFTPPQMLRVGVERSGKRTGRWLVLSGLTVVALLSVRACMPASADHQQVPLPDATLDVGAPSRADSYVDHYTPPAAPVASAPDPERTSEVAAVAPPKDAPAATDSTVPSKKLAPEPRALPAKRAAHKPAASGDPAPAENVVPYDKATLAQALNAAVQQAEQCDLWGRATGTAKLFVTFAPTGKVSDARLVGEPLESSAVARCILHHARGASLPPFQGPEFTISRKITLR